jgi:hypothetical protein
MKNYAALFLLLAFPIIVKADCGKSVELSLKRYLVAINEANYEYISQCASVDALNSYVQTVQHFVEKYPSVSTGNPAWAESLNLLKEGKINQKELFIKIKTAQKDRRTADHTKIESLEYIGSIKENKKTHVLYRAIPKEELVPSVQPKVFSFILEEGQWKYAYFTYL